MKTVLKGLFMTTLVALAAMWKTSGMPETPIAWEVLGLTVLGTDIVYFFQSYFRNFTFLNYC